MPKLKLGIHRLKKDHRRAWEEVEAGFEGSSAICLLMQILTEIKSK